MAVPLLVTCQMPRRFAAGLPVAVVVVLKNVRQSAMVLDDQVGNLVDLSVHVQRQGDDHWLPKAGHEDYPGLTWFGLRSSMSFRMVPSGQTTTQTFRLDRDWDLSKPGSYTLAVDDPIEHRIAVMCDFRIDGRAPRP